MLNALTTIANDHNSQITHHECFGDFIIGMDKTKGFVFFYKQMKGETIEQFINLAEIRMCEVINGTRSVADHGGYFQIIDKLDLSFIPIAANRPPIVLNFYDAEDNLQLSGELQFIEKWAKRINDELQNKK